MGSREMDEADSRMSLQVTRRHRE